MQALAECGGMLGMMAIPFAVDPEAPTLRRWLDHFDRAVAVMGVEHVGIGADLIFNRRKTWTVRPDEAPEGVAPGKTRPALDDFAEPVDYPALVDGLRERGNHGERLDAILSGNSLRILRRACAA